MRYFFVLVLFLGLCCAWERIPLPSEDFIPDEEEERWVKNIEALLNEESLAESSIGTRSSFGYFDVMNSDIFRGKYRTFKDSTVCLLCRAAARILIGYRRMGAPKEDLVTFANKVCTGAKLASETVCKGAINLNVDTFLYIIDNKPELSARKVCSILAQPYGCKESFRSSNKDNVEIPPMNDYNKEYRFSQNAPFSDPIRILHFTDIHFDEIYEPGSNALCGDPLCCGNNQGKPANSSAAAGYWGDYRYCDTPWHTLVNVMQQVKKHDYDIVYYTGDSINHRVWATNDTSNGINIKRVNALIRETFKSIPVYPILGNHEPSPVNVFAPTNITLPELSTQWLFDLCAEEWSYWLPESTMSTIRKGGYYSVLVRPGFRIIALNSNVAYTFNWWLLWNDNDPFDQLQWLTDTLAEAERLGEFVHILSHVPTGDDTCLTSWASQYNKIIQRFHKIIAVQINGHTHFDEFSLFYSSNDPKEPISVAYNGGSVTTFFSLNPNYRIMTVNPENYKVEDYEEWTFNMTEANLYGINRQPEWYKLYSFKSAWNIKDMKNLTEIDQVVKDIARNKDKFDLYFKLKVREGDPFLEEGCDTECQEDNICRLVTTIFGEKQKCDELIKDSFLNQKKNNK